VVFQRTVRKCGVSSMLFLAGLSAVSNGRKLMIRSSAAIAAALVTATVAFAQNAPPTYQGDPDVYKVIFEDQNFRVIATNRKKGVHDKEHGHPLPSVVYNITDCTTKIYTPDGKTSEMSRKRVRQAQFR
jgi:hypothetical protein